MNSTFKRQLSQFFITQQKNESVCEITEQFFYIRRAQNVPTSWEIPLAVF